MCALTARGAVRIEQQLSGQSVLLPQGGEVHLTDGQLNTLRSGAGSCTCELLVTQNVAPRQVELSVPVRPEPARPRPVTPMPAPRAAEPIYRVYMPPLTYDATAPDPSPDPDPAAILMVREAPPLPELFFRGQVEPTPEAAIDYSPQREANRPGAVVKAKRGNFFSWFFGIFRRQKSPCVGAGCGASVVSAAQGPG
jgi:hypothetical protein